MTALLSETELTVEALQQPSMQHGELVGVHCAGPYGETCEIFSGPLRSYAPLLIPLCALTIWYKLCGETRENKSRRDQRCQPLSAEHQNIQKELTAVREQKAR